MSCTCTLVWKATGTKSTITRFSQVAVLVGLQRKNVHVAAWMCTVAVCTCAALITKVRLAAGPLQSPDDLALRRSMPQELCGKWKKVFHIILFSTNHKALMQRGPNLRRQTVMVHILHHNMHIFTLQAHWDSDLSPYLANATSTVCSDGDY